MLHLDDPADDKQKDKLVDAVGKIADNHAGNHFLTLGAVQNFAGEIAAQDGCRHGDNRRRRQGADAGHVQNGHNDQTHLAAHSAQYDAEVHAQTAGGRDDEGEDQQNVSVKAVDQIGQNG